MRRRTAASIILLALLASSACTTPLPPPTPTATPPPTQTPTAVPPTATTAPSPIPTSTPEPAPDTPTPDLIVVEDVPYLQPVAPGARDRALDIYAPPTASDPGYPIVIYLHGKSQNKSALGRPSRTVAEQGAVVFTPTYPTDAGSPDAWREMSEAVTCAVQYARAHAPTYGGDPDNVTVVGFSLGGAVGALVALAEAQLVPRWDELADRHGGPHQQVVCHASEPPVRVDAFVGIGGAYSRLIDPGQSVSGSTAPDPLAHLLAGPGANPDLRLRLLQGEFDSTVVPQVATDFGAWLEDAGYDVAVINYDSGHTVPRELAAATVMQLASGR